MPYLVLTVILQLYGLSPMLGGGMRQSTNLPGTPAPAITDTSAFATCP